MEALKKRHVYTVALFVLLVLEVLIVMVLFYAHAAHAQSVTPSDPAQDLTSRDLKLIAIGIFFFVSVRFIDMFRWRGRD